MDGAFFDDFDGSVCPFESAYVLPAIVSRVCPPPTHTLGYVLPAIACRPNDAKRAGLNPSPPVLGLRHRYDHLPSRYSPRDRLGLHAAKMATFGRVADMLFAAGQLPIYAMAATFNRTAPPSVYQCMVPRFYALRR